MPIQTESLNKTLYEMLKVRGYNPKSLDSSGKPVPVPDEADVFKFTFSKDGKDFDNVWVTLEGPRNIVLYYDDDVMDSGSENTSKTGNNDTWLAFVKNLKNWAMRRQLGFELKNGDHLAYDMAQREDMKKKENISEGYYPMGKSASYNDNVPTVKIILQHTRQIQEGEQRYRNIARIFLENTQGERILAPTNKPGIAQVYARHLAEGGVPNDERWNHLKSLCEEYSSMAGFVRAVRGNQFNESAQRLVEEGLNHYQSLRESLGKMRGSRGYNAYFESWTPTLMENEGEETNLNELFVQETLDPRIESVMPILSRLRKNIGEMKEVSALAEWADSIIEDESLTSNNPIGIPEGLDQYSPVTQAITRRILSQHPDLLQKHGPEKVANAIDDVAEFVGDVEEIGSSDVSGWVKQVAQSLGGHEGMEETIDIDTLNQLASHPMAGPLAAAGGAAIGATIGKGITKAANWYKNRQEKKAQDYDMRGNKVAEEVDTGQYDAAKSSHKGGPTPEQEKSFREKVQAYGKELEQRQKEKEKGMAEGDGDHQIRPGMKVSQGTVVKVDGNTVTVKTSNGDMMTMNIHDIDQAVSEDLDANQKRVGQLGPTEKVKNNNIGKLVGANENFINTVDQAVVSEEDEMAEGVLDAIKKGVAGAKQFGQDFKAAGKEAWDEVVPQLKQDWKHPIQAAMAKEGEMDEGAHTQHYDAANKFTGDIDHGDRPPTDFSVDPIEAGTDRIHQKISSMLKKLSKPKDTKELDEAAAPCEDEDEAEKREKEGKEPKDSKGSDGSEHGGHSRAKHLAKNAIPKEKEEVKEGQDDLDTIIRLVRK